jgi:hypothetical protein
MMYLAGNMYYSLAQIYLLGQDYDIEGWMDILVLVVIAVVYGLGALIRAKSKKNEEQIQQQHARKAQGKPSKDGRGLLEQIFTELKQATEEAKTGVETRQPDQKRPQKAAQAQTVSQKYTPKAKQEVHIQPTMTPAKTKPSKPSKVQSGFEKLGELDKGIYTLPDITSKLSVLSGKDKVIPDEAFESIHLSEVLSDYEDPEELKRAILHYEILGRPLSLRDPSGQIIGL